MQPTQTRHPWRATARTVAAALVAALVIAPQILAETGLSETAYGAQALAVIGAVTRVLAIPGVDGWLRRYVPWLAAEPAGVVRSE
ncbi:hypothetical protein ABZ807_09530 [Micromonospora sp. NPDC047548]|uniref:hypothetical protein n=1 Tax=Micromonospora sp. NPDC047548 TaxID=3155624 RepID=UPI00340B55B9